MNRKDVREQAMDFVGLSDARSIGGFDPVRTANRCALDAHREVQMECMRIDPTLFVQRMRFTYEKDALRVDTDDKFGIATIGTIHKLVGLGTLKYDSEISNTNVLSPMIPFRIGPQATGPMVAFSSGYVNPATGAAIGWTGPAFAGIAYNYRLQNNWLYVSPIPTEDLIVYAEWYPLLVFGADDALVLGGNVPMAETMVVYKTAELIGKEKGFIEKGMVAQAMYEERRAKLPNFIEKRPANMGFVNFRHPDS